MQLSEHFSIEELTTTSHRNLDNTPSSEIIEHLKITAAGLESVRKLLFDLPIHINSGYRSTVVNKAVGGSPTSDHPHGWCADFICPQFGTPIDICRKIAESSIKFDQLIEEGTWVHISFSPKMRGEILTKNSTDDYIHGLHV